jgi:hypothetical protein
VLGLECEAVRPLIKHDTTELIEALAKLLLAALGHTGEQSREEGEPHEPEDHT